MKMKTYSFLPICKSRWLIIRLARQSIQLSSIRRKFFYYVLGNGKAIRYGIGIGREGFAWSGVKLVERKRMAGLVSACRDDCASALSTAHGGRRAGNPLGARALYIAGTQYRIDGTNDPTTIGKHVSSGCIRLTNDNIIDLYGRVKVGAKVIVLPMEQRHTFRSPALAKPGTRNASFRLFCSGRFCTDGTAVRCGCNA